MRWYICVTKQNNVTKVTLSVRKGHYKLFSISSFKIFQIRLKSSCDIGLNSAELADVVALQVIEFLGVSNKYTSLRRKGPVVSLSSHQQGQNGKTNSVGLFLCLLLWLPFSSSGNAWGGKKWFIFICLLLLLILILYYSKLP